MTTTTAPAAPNHRRKIPWDAIEPMYRVGTLSLRELARIFGTHASTISDRAKAHGWDRNLTARVAEKTSAMMAGGGMIPGGTQQAASRDPALYEEAVIELAARATVEVVKSHRKLISRLNKLVEEQAGALEAYFCGKGFKEKTFGKSEGVGGALAQLTAATTRVVTLERQAFNIDAAAGAGTGQDTLEARVNAHEAAEAADKADKEQHQAAIRARHQKTGKPLVDQLREQAADVEEDQVAA